MRLLPRINLWLFATFLVFTAAAFVLLRTVLHDDARNDALAEARLLMSAARAARDYTSHEVGPVIERLGGGADGSGTSEGHAQSEFVVQTIPAYAANRIFTALSDKYPEYSYREAALNPTNPSNRALSWEAEIIAHFRSNGHAIELVNEHQGELGRQLYLATPIRIDDAQCLSCHDRADNAPSAFVGRYGPNHGFGWQLHETIGAQIVQVPLSTAIARADRALRLLVSATTALFVLIFVVVNVIVRQLVLRRLAVLARATRELSTGQALEHDLAPTGIDEIADLCRSFQRMQVSIEKSMELLSRNRRANQARC